MTVQELIDILKDCNPTYPVFVYDLETADRIDIENVDTDCVGVVDLNFEKE